MKNHASTPPEPSCAIPQDGGNGWFEHHTEHILGMVGDHVGETTEMIFPALRTVWKSEPPYAGCFTERKGI
jgi:hypothetical protein